MDVPNGWSSWVDKFEMKKNVERKKKVSKENKSVMYATDARDYVSRSWIRIIIEKCQQYVILCGLNLKNM